MEVRDSANDACVQGEAQSDREGKKRHKHTCNKCNIYPHKHQHACTRMHKIQMLVNMPAASRRIAFLEYD